MQVVTDFRRQVSVALRELGVQTGQGYLVACSHGPDSLALADAVAGCRRLLGARDVVLVYVDHGLRPGSGDEGRAVEAFARQAGVGSEVRAVQVQPAGKGLEAAARDARYQALEDIATARGLDWILTGHNAGDQAETLVERLLRGTGPRGLAGIFARRGRLLRPLLGIPRVAIEEYLARRRLEPSRDTSNDVPRFLRNRVRHDLMPRLRKENPRIEQALVRLAAAERETADALGWAEDLAWDAAVTVAPGDATLDAVKVASLPSALARAVLRRALLHAAGRGAEVGKPHLDALLDLARGAPGRRLDLPGASATREPGRVCLTRTRV